MKAVYEHPDYRVEVMGKIDGEEICERDYVILYVVSGQITVNMDAKLYQVKEEEILLGNSLSHIRLKMESSAVYSKLFFSETALRKYNPGREYRFFCTPGKRESEAYTQAKEYLNKILTFSITRQMESRPFEGTALLYQLLDILVQNFPDDQGGEGFYDAEKRKVLQYLEAHYQEHITLRTVADNTYLSYHNLSHRFQSIFGKKFYELLDETRMRHVLDDLLYTDKSITRIAADNGYSSSSVLNRNFRSRYGMVPGEYRKTARAEIQNKSPHRAKESGGEGAARIPVPGVESQADSVSLLRAGAPGEAPVQGHDLPEMGGKIKTIAFCGEDSGEGDSFANTFGTMINGGHALDLLDASVQKQILTLCRELGFRYVRFYGPFCREMDIQRGREFSSVSFRKLDLILDFLVGHGLRPWIDFGNKPHNIIDEMSNKSIQIHSEDRGFMRTQEEVRSLITLLDSFIRHIICRYGRAEASEWIFEFWNDRYQMKEEILLRDEKWYLQLFDQVFEVIKQYLPDAQVGGDGIPLMYRNYDILKEWRNHRKPDFISCIFFPYDGLEESRTLKEENIAFSTNIFSFASELQKFRREMKESHLDVKLAVSEFNSTVSNRDFQNDSCYQSSFLIMHAIAAAGLADVVGFWCASDLPFLAYDTDTPVFGGSGILTADGIRKPVYYALDFLNQVRGQILCRNEYGVLTGTPDGAFMFLGHNFQKRRIDYYVQPGGYRDVVRHLETEGESLVFAISAEAEENAPYTCIIWRTGAQHGNLLREWYRLGCPREMDPRQTAYLKAACGPSLERKRVTAKGGKLDLEVEVSCLEILFVQLIPGG